MGADFLLWSVPDAELTDDRVAELREIVLAIPEERLLSDTENHWGGDEDEDEAAHSKVIDAIEELANARDRRDVARMEYKDWPFPILCTGGLSFGDDPTEASLFFGIIEEVPAVWNKLAEWATEDQRKAGEN